MSNENNLCLEIMTDTSATTTNDTTVSDESTELDLAFIIDATGSMGSYIKSAQDVCRRIHERLKQFELFRI